MLWFRQWEIGGNYNEEKKKKMLPCITLSLKPKSEHVFCGPGGHKVFSLKAVEFGGLGGEGDWRWGVWMIALFFLQHKGGEWESSCPNNWIMSIIGLFYEEELYYFQLYRNAV
jgi:hypothetical protein